MSERNIIYMAENLKPIIDIDLNEVLILLHLNAIAESKKAQPDIKIMNSLIGDAKVDSIHENAGEHIMLAEYTADKTIAGDKLKDACKDAFTKYVQMFADLKSVNPDDLNDIVTFMTDQKQETSESLQLDYTKPMLENLFTSCSYSDMIDEAYSASEESATYEKTGALSVLNVGYALPFKVEIEGKKEKDLRSNMNECKRFALFAKDLLFAGLVAGTYFIEKNVLKLAYSLGKGAVKISYVAGSSALAKGYDITKGLTKAGYDVVKGFSNTAYSLAKGALGKIYDLGKGAIGAAYGLGKGIAKGVGKLANGLSIHSTNGDINVDTGIGNAVNGIGRAVDKVATTAGNAADKAARGVGRAADATARTAGNVADKAARGVGRAADATARTAGNVADKAARAAGDVGDKALRTTADIADKGARAVGRFAKDWKGTKFGKWLDQTFGKKNIKSIESSFNKIVSDEFGEGAIGLNVVPWPIDLTFEQQLRKTGKINSNLLDMIRENKGKGRYCFVVYVPYNIQAYKDFNKNTIAQLFTNALRKNSHDFVIKIDPEKNVYLVKGVENNALASTTDESIRIDNEKKNLLAILFEAKDRSSFDDFLDWSRAKDRYNNKDKSDMYIVIVGDRKLSNDEEVA